MTDPGGLIGEFNRLTKNWRVVYTCATRQLAHQTCGLLKSYGINAVVLVGKRENFNSTDYGSYARSEAVAVTTYSHIFNINSSFQDAHQIIFDDAHAAEYSIYGFWNLTISRKKYKDIFDGLYSTLGDAIAKNVQDKIVHGTYDPLTDGVDIIPQSLWMQRLDDIRTILDVKVDGTNLYFPWSRIRSHLHACQIFLSHSSIVIGPILPPNLRHPAFAHAQERIYMTATVGSGGEMERTFGVKNIYKISKFESGANKVSGRRLILFPEDHFDSETIDDVLANTIRMQPRALVLCPSEPILDEMKQLLESIVPEYKLFYARDVEDTMEPFTTSQNGILLLSGRYEGIDLKDSDCRLQLFVELPTALGLPEQFLQDRLKATEIFENQLLTRLVQGLGRCTRGTKDYAAVLFFGNRIGKYLYKDEFRKLLPAEIDSEMTLGFSQIEHIKDKESWLKSLQDFYEQGKAWKEAEDYIKYETVEKNKDRKINPSNQLMMQAVINEVDYLYSLWDGDWEKAHQAADRTINQYGRNDSMKGYRAWWNYLIACLSVLQQDFEKAKEFHNKAIQAAPYKLWLDKRVFDAHEIDDIVVPELFEQQVNSVLSILESYGDRNTRFEKEWQKVRNGLQQKNAEQYEIAFCSLGKFLGYQTERPLGKGTPDSVWNIELSWVVFEIKSNIENAESAIPLDDIRQAYFHDKWVQHHRNIPEDAEIYNVLICAKQFVEQYAAHATNGIYLLDPTIIESIMEKTENILRTVLGKLKYSTYDDARATLVSLLKSNSVDAVSLQKLFCEFPLKNTVG